MRNFDLDKQPSTLLAKNTPQNNKSDPLTKIRKSSVNLHSQQLYQDDQFKMQQQHQNKNIIKKRLRDIFQPGTSIQQAHIKQGQQINLDLWKGQKNPSSRPSYLSEMKMLPQWHYISLIQPQTINPQGYYHVAVVKEGQIVKITIDDFLYFDQKSKEILCHPYLQSKPWVHIILKVWAKLKKSYEMSCQAQPFSFVRAFTYPDWRIFNPALQKLETIIRNFSLSQDGGRYFYAAKTKSNPKVGHYGLTPSCTYLITGYYQQYASIFIKVKSFVGDRWNGQRVDSGSQRNITQSMPSETIPLEDGQFIMPLRQFVNVFHIVFVTTNKYDSKIPLFYTKFKANLDARESQPQFIKIQVEGKSNQQVQVNLNIYFPTVNSFDLAFKRPTIAQNQIKVVVPYCKMLLGRQIDCSVESSYAQSLKQAILNNQQDYFIAFNPPKYDFVFGKYFYGFANGNTHLLRLKPGKYIFRLKIQKLLPQYQALVNITSQREVRICQAKMTQHQQQQFLSQILSSKSRKQQKNVIFPNQNRKQTWIMLNNDWQRIGYNTILMQVGKNDNRCMTIDIDQKKLRKSGYVIKNRLLFKDLESRIKLVQGQCLVLVLRELHKEEKVKYGSGKTKWPPEGIEVSYSEVETKPKIQF